MMMDRGKIYLKRFKNLSKAFETGEFRATINIDADTEKAEAWNVFYINVDTTLSASYGEIRGDREDL
jgi:hypothetical protein